MGGVRQGPGPSERSDTADRLVAPGPSSPRGGPSGREVRAALHGPQALRGRGAGAVSGEGLRREGPPYLENGDRGGTRAARSGAPGTGPPVCVWPRLSTGSGASVKASRGGSETGGRGGVSGATAGGTRPRRADRGAVGRPSRTGYLNATERVREGPRRLNALELLAEGPTIAPPLLTQVRRGCAVQVTILVRAERDQPPTPRCQNRELLHSGQVGSWPRGLKVSYRAARSGFWCDSRTIPRPQSVHVSLSG